MTIFCIHKTSMIYFPKLHRESTLDVAPLAGISAIVSGILFVYSVVLGLIALTPIVLWLMYSAWLGLLNSRLRYRWALQFTQRLTVSQLRKFLQGESQRYVVHIRYYGGFDTAPLKPAAVLEDRQTGELAAVHPASWRVSQLCEKMGVSIIRK